MRPLKFIQINVRIYVKKYVNKYPKTRGGWRTPKAKRQQANLQDLRRLHLRTKSTLVSGPTAYETSRQRGPKESRREETRR